ncbi:MAG: hypothetical protein MUF42_14215 [Cytophagaceae bacterium]|jgi:hypothetical protein|nr:hypothetical protein [Cytophagaceae bacterium]
MRKQSEYKFDDFSKFEEIDQTTKELILEHYKIHKSGEYSYLEDLLTFISSASEYFYLMSNVFFTKRKDKIYPGRMILVSKDVLISEYYKIPEGFMLMIMPKSLEYSITVNDEGMIQLWKASES